MWAQRVRHRVDTVGDARDERLAWADMQARTVNRGRACGTRAEWGEGGTGDAGGELEQAREEGAGPCERWPRRARAERWAACGSRLEKRGRGRGGLGCFGLMG